MKIHVLSDLHLEFSKPSERLGDVASDVVVLAGDIHMGALGIAWAAKTWLDRPVIYVPGNHEYYRNVYESTQLAMRAEAANYDNIFILDRGSLVIDDVLFAGATLWTDFQYLEPGNGALAERSMQFASTRMNDFVGLIRKDKVCAESKHITTFTARDSVDICTLDHAYLQEVLSKKSAELEALFQVPCIRKRVAISHHLPSALSVSDQYADSELTPAFASRFERTVQLADLWIHGHTHDSMDYYLPDEGGGQGSAASRIVCNPRGYSTYTRPVENTKFDPSFVVEI